MGGGVMVIKADGVVVGVGVWATVNEGATMSNAVVAREGIKPEAFECFFNNPCGEVVFAFMFSFVSCKTVAVLEAMLF